MDEQAAHEQAQENFAALWIRALKHNFRSFRVTSQWEEKASYFGNAAFSEDSYFLKIKFSNYRWSFLEYQTNKLAE